MPKTVAIAFAAATLLLTGMASAGEVEDTMRALAEQKIKTWVGDPVVVEAIKAQNARNANLSQADIDRLDMEWRAEVEAANRPLIDKVLATDLSRYLQNVKSDAQGVYSEIFVMDDKGLNVGQSDVTSDYWQGDEAKWQQTFLVGPDALHVSEVELDESTQTYQSQVSLPVVDPATNTVIGAVTVGVDVDAAMQ